MPYLGLIDIYMNSAAKKSLIKVLLVDPQKITLWGINELISRDQSYSICSTASTCQEALESAGHFKPDLILLEPNFDHDDGLKLVSDLLQACDSKILILTSSRNALMLDQAIVKGARGLVSKNESPETLFKAMEKIHQGERWLNRDATSRILEQVTRPEKHQEISPQQKALRLLTPKEQKVTQAIQLYSRNTLREIAGNLHISEHTLRNHLASIYEKVGVRNRMELYVFCGQYQKTVDPENHPKRRVTDL